MERTEAMAKIKEIMMDTFDLDENKITESLNLRNDLGADSISMMEFVLELENAFDVEVEDEDMDKIQTIGDVLDYVAK